jgi:hypothetical protein
MGDLAEAEALLRQVQDDEKRIDVLTAFYARHLQEVDANGVPFRQHCDALRDRIFVNGVGKVALSDFTEPPYSGVTFTKDNGGLKTLGMRAGDVIVAVDGCRIENDLHYVYVRNLNPDNDRMALTVWNGKSYVEIDAWVQGRKFGLPMKNYSP